MKPPKSLISLRLVLLAIFLTPCLGHAAGRTEGYPPNSTYPVKYPEEWFDCRNDEDCLKTYDCADITINRDYSEQFQKAQWGCDGAVISDPKTVAKCIENKCSLITPDQHK